MPWINKSVALEKTEDLERIEGSHRIQTTRDLNAGADEIEDPTRTGERSPTKLKKIFKVHSGAILHEQKIPRR